MNYASRWARFFAWVIDIIVLIIITFILAAVGVVDFERTSDITTSDGVISAVIVLAYFVVLTVAFGATLGKMALGMRVVGADGGKAGSGAILIREIIIRFGVTITAFVLTLILSGPLGDSGAAIGGLVGVLVGLVVILRILVDDHRQGWHDKIGGTFVVKAK